RDWSSDVCSSDLENGLLISQGESPMFNEKVFTELYHTLEGIFGKQKTHCMLFSIPTYPTGIWSFQVASKGSIHPTESFDMQLAADFAEKHELNYYNEAMQW